MSGLTSKKMITSPIWSLFPSIYCALLNHASEPDFTTWKWSLSRFSALRFTGTADRWLVHNIKGRHIFWAENKHDSKISQPCKTALTTGTWPVVVTTSTSTFTRSSELLSQQDWASAGPKNYDICYKEENKVSFTTEPSSVSWKVVQQRSHQYVHRIESSRHDNDSCSALLPCLHHITIGRCLTLAPCLHHAWLLDSCTMLCSTLPSIILSCQLGKPVERHPLWTTLVWTKDRGWFWVCGNNGLSFWGCEREEERGKQIWEV